MIATLRGRLIEKHSGGVLVECAGVGYEVSVMSTAEAALPAPGGEVFLRIVESFGMYGGGATLYGFLSASDKAMFLALRDHVPGTGAKKALEYLDKAAKSLPDFRRAVIDKDVKLLTGVFGFTKKTAEKLVDSLKDKLEDVAASGSHKIARADAPNLPASALAQALAALAALGYKPSEARVALQAVAEEAAGRELGVEQIIRIALKTI